MKLTFIVNQKDIEVLVQDTDQDIRKVITNTINQLGENLVQFARQTTKFNHGNHFDEGITYQLLSPLQGEVRSEVYNSKDVEYSNFLEFGNDPGGGRIYPVHAKALHFFAGGQEIFAKSVSAIDPAKTGFFTDAVNQTSDQVQEVFTEEFQKLFK
jgi:hypothetical protein